MKYSIIVTLHSEGNYSLGPLRSIINGARAVDGEGEILLILDKATNRTKDIARSFARRVGSAARVYEVDCGDVGKARNEAIGIASGDFLFICDGDDLYSSNWFCDGIGILERSKQDVIVHPEWNLIFGSQSFWWRHAEQDRILPIELTFSNPWTSLSGGRRAVYRSVRYPEREASDVFQFEDWEWNIKTLRAGISHLIVPETVHAIRYKPGSRNAEASKSKVLSCAIV